MGLKSIAWSKARDTFQKKTFFAYLFKRIEIISRMQIGDQLVCASFQASLESFVLRDLRQLNVPEEMGMCLYTSINCDSGELRYYYALRLRVISFITCVPILTTEYRVLKQILNIFQLIPNFALLRLVNRNNSNCLSFSSS